MLFQVAVTWGKRLDLAVEDWEDEKKTRKRTALFEAVATVNGDKSPQSISKLLKLTEPPDRRVDQQRAVTLLVALGENANDYGLSESVLGRDINAASIRRALRLHNATWRTAA